MVLSLGLLVACGGRWQIPEFPGDVGDDALEHAIAELKLSKVVVDRGALCTRREPARSETPSSETCQAPRELVLDAPDLRDVRRDAAWGLSTRARYARVVGRLEHALVRSHARSPARKKLLTWLTTALMRWRSSGESRASECAAHYLALLSDEHPPGRRQSVVRYLWALELELSGRGEEARAEYAKLVDTGELGIGRSAAQAALGDHAFQRSFCDASLLPVAHGHYLAAAHGPAPPDVPLTGYVRLRLAQIDLGMHALGPAYRQLDLAEQDLYVAPDTWRGSRLDRLRRLHRQTLSALVSGALGDGTLRLLAAFEPPGRSLCEQLKGRAAETANAGEREQVESTLGSWCGFLIDPERECVATAGCTPSTAGARRSLPAK